MEWKLYDENGVFLQEVNCQYDSLDIASMLFEAQKVEIDFGKKEAKIIKKQDEPYVKNT